MSRTVIRNANIVNEGTVTSGALVIDGETIDRIIPASDAVSLDEALKSASAVTDAGGAWLLPGIIDEHVHFREPGLTHKADIASESRAAVAGGVTTFFDMPNCKPATVSAELLEQKFRLAEEKSLANYSFYIGATADNLDLIEKADRTDACGVKLFMGSSTGNMLLSDPRQLERLFKASPLPVAAHCEETPYIDRNMALWQEHLGTEPPVEYHSVIRSPEACYVSSAKAVEMADKAGARLHVLHISTARELTLFSSGPVSGKRITAEACPAHLMFTEKDYAAYGTRIKCNPSVKGQTDLMALRAALRGRRIDAVGTDHAPHLLTEKQGGCISAASGMPILPYSLPVMMQLAAEGFISITDIAELMCHNPARIYSVKGRGFLRPGYKADLVLVSSESCTASARFNRCGWNPFQDTTLQGTVLGTWVNGNRVYSDGHIIDTWRGQKTEFCR